MTVYPDPNRCPPCAIITEDGYTAIDLGDWPGYVKYTHLIGPDDIFDLRREFTEEDLETFLQDNQELMDRLANSEGVEVELSDKAKRFLKGEDD